MTQAPHLAPPEPPLPARPEPPRRTAWSEGVAQLRATAVTEPGRLRVIGALLAAALVAFGAVTAGQVAQRASAADAVIHGSQPLSVDAAEIYRSLADANTTAASGFLAGGQEPRQVRDRYERAVRTAARLITRAAGSGGGSPSARRELRTLNERLPVYTGLVEAARANNRQGLPIGGAYLRYADERMREELLPAARRLYAAESARYRADHAEASAWPWQALALGGLVLGALVWAQRRHYLRTNRVFNRGLLAATGAALVLLVWLAAGHGVARGQLAAAEDHGARSLHTLNEALAAALEARGDEGMTLVARGGGAGYEETYRESMARLAGGATDGEPDGSAAGRAADGGGLLARALRLADDDAGRAPVRGALRDVREWHERHAEVRELDNTGAYGDAVAKVIGRSGTTGETFDRVDAALREAIGHEQDQFTRSAKSGRAASDGLPAGAGALALAGAAGAVTGIGRRLAEYR
ncbi:hypothetical protein V1J52_09135 [Streptomyces sp. TRM 70351]|uniref:hypothetical protein n=1 Tax=Streptomyces sp. TRM 70351 TaxID=3116552 RepID=UPI002E7BD752|nr:hypothetical protein [Streptomyces sp. TRM 70351]MEE1928356.1 hypothetical protein [Streptomyces sp. TRM 70351]